MGRNSEGSDLKGGLRLGQKYLVRNSHLGGRGGTSARKGGVKHQGGLRLRILLFVTTTVEFRPMMIMKQIYYNHRIATACILYIIYIERK